MEAIRRYRTNRRKISAIKRIIGRELETNAFAIGNLKGALNHIDDYYSGAAPGELQITKDASGIERFQKAKPGSGDWSSFPLFKVRDDNMLKYLMDIAAIDDKLFSLTQTAIDSVIEARHIRDSILEHVISPTEFTHGFPSYGRKVLEASLLDLAALYKFCTGLDKFRARVR